MRPLTHADVRRIALALPDASEGSHHGHADLRVGTKIFAGLPAADTHSVNLKSTPVNVGILVRSDPETFRDAWGGRWIGVNLARIDRPTLRALIEDAWELAAPPRLRQASRRSK